MDEWLLEIDKEDAMGTVGLSFGSPTSGAGFDVSSTVATIVGNLQEGRDAMDDSIDRLA